MLQSHTRRQQIASDSNKVNWIISTEQSCWCTLATTILNKPHISSPHTKIGAETQEGVATVGLDRDVFRTKSHSTRVRCQATPRNMTTRMDAGLVTSHSAQHWPVGRQHIEETHEQQRPLFSLERSSERAALISPQLVDDWSTIQGARAMDPYEYRVDTHPPCLRAPQSHLSEGQLQMNHLKYLRSFIDVWG